jgi:RNA polymerase sigma-70 factor, ECF subfamily
MPTVATRHAGRPGGRRASPPGRPYQVSGARHESVEPSLSPGRVGDMDTAEDFDAFYRSGHRRVVGQVYAMVGDLREAEDAVQEAYCRAWLRRRQLAEYANPEAWVRTVAYRIAVSSWRRAVRRMTAYRRHGPAGDVDAIGPEHVVVVDALRALPAAQRQAVVLFHLVGLSVEEISREADVAVGTVKSRLSRGRSALAMHFQEFAPAGTPSRPARGEGFDA